MFKIVLLVVAGLLVVVLVGDVVMRQLKARGGDQAPGDGSMCDLGDALNQMVSEKHMSKPPAEDD